MADLTNNHFKMPWTVIVFFAAIFVINLYIVQTDRVVISFTLQKRVQLPTNNVVTNRIDKLSTTFSLAIAKNKLSACTLPTETSVGYPPVNFIG